MNNNLSEYADPAVYDDENNEFEPDGPFYRELIEQYGQPVLDIACGTGRLTIPLAQQGIAITGLDIVPPMLERARQKAGDLPIQWIEADARSFQLNTRFKVIFASGFFQHLLERADQEAVLRNVRAHLAPGGCFAFPIFFPHADSLEDAAEEQEWFSYTNAQGQLVTVTGTDQYDPIRQVRTETAIRRWTDANGQEVVLRAPLQQRQFFPQEIEMLLHNNGFKVIACYGDWEEKRPLAPDDRVMMLVCQLLPSP
jgi:ubiquinone/menaquinone biosynthesis C-methylase UbiE